MKLHFNSSNGIFSVRRYDRSTVAASERHGKIPAFLGDTIELAPSVHILVTVGSYVAASAGKRPVLPVVVTKWPKVRLFVARVKEVLNADCK